MKDLYVCDDFIDLKSDDSLKVDNREKQILVNSPNHWMWIKSVADMAT